MSPMADDAITRGCIGSLESPLYICAKNLRNAKESGLRPHLLYKLLHCRAQSQSRYSMWNVDICFKTTHLQCICRWTRCDITTYWSCGWSTFKSAKIQLYNFSTWSDVSLCSSNPPLSAHLFSLTQNEIFPKIFSKKCQKLTRKLFWFCIFTKGK